MTFWIDSHCHLDAPEFRHDVQAVHQRAQAAGVRLCVIPAVQPQDFAAARALAWRLGHAYALGIHPLFTSTAPADALAQLEAALLRWVDDPRLVAVGEIGLDFFVPALTAPGALRERQLGLFQAQLKLARRFGLPVILHTRRSVDAVLKHLRQAGVAGGLAHAFNGSVQQAQQLLGLGFKLGFGGAATYARATRLQALIRQLPPEALVLETDSPDMPPHWVYVPAAERAGGQAQGRNEPAELPRIAAEVARCRGVGVAALAALAQANTLAALPRLGALLQAPPPWPADLPAAMSADLPAQP